MLRLENMETVESNVF